MVDGNKLKILSLEKYDDSIQNLQYKQSFVIFRLNALFLK